MGRLKNRLLARFHNIDSVRRCRALSRPVVGVNRPEGVNHGRNVSRRQAVRIIGAGVATGVEGLGPKQPGQFAKVYLWEITAGYRSIWRSDRTSSLVPNEYGVARAVAGLPAQQFLMAFDPNMTVGEILAHPDQSPPRYWEANRGAAQ